MRRGRVLKHGFEPDAKFSDGHFPCFAGIGNGSYRVDVSKVARLGIAVFVCRVGHRKQPCPVMRKNQA